MINPSDRFVTRLLAWLRAIISTESATFPDGPLYKLVAKTRWENGELWEVQLDPQRWPLVVYSAIFVPFRFRSQEQDCWLLCELIEARGEPQQQGTHYIKIFLATRHLRRIEPDLIAVMHEAEWNLQGGRSNRNDYIRCIMGRVAEQLRIDDPLWIQWEALIELAIQECQHGTLMGLSLSRPPIDAIARAYDWGTTDARIKGRPRPSNEGLEPRQD